MDILHDISATRIIEGVLITVLSAATLGLLWKWRCNIFSTIAILCRTARKRTHALMRYRHHAAYLRRLIRQHRQLRRHFAASQAQLAELQLQRTQENPQLTEHQIRLLATVAEYERIELFDLAEELKWNPNYTKATALTLENLRLLIGDHSMAGDKYLISYSGLLYLRNADILREDGIATHSLINT